ncbi:MAG TPA: L-rhamnose/proton symporter RhaT [Terracidiphilus sp.]|nr:L-rhamnose/proton symporter RhaT [Terracidiphilus sp.]
MIFANSALAWGVAFVIVAGVMCGAFALPMKYLGRWSWENVWAIFILVSCVLMPVLMTRATAPAFVQVLRTAPAGALAAAVLTGFAWGFGAIMFGQGVSAVGLSMANTLVLAISAALGSFLPIGLLAPAKLAQPQGRAIISGTLVGIVGIALCGYAGFLREKSQGIHKERLRGGMVGKARPIAIGLALCVGAGLLSAVLNIGYALAQPVLAAALRTGYSAFAGSNIVWLLMLTSGAVPNLCFCAYLLRKNATWKKYALPHAAALYGLTVLMGLLWGGDIFLYGFASPKIGRLGPAIGWPLKLIAGLITANVMGYFIGEWKLTRAKDRVWMTVGLLVQFAAILVLGWSTTLG